MRGHPPVRALLLLLAAVLLAGPLSGCGRRGGLEPPLDPSVKAADASDDTLAPVPSRPRRQLIKPPQASFVLDPLL